MAEYQVSHQITVDGDPDAAFDLIARVERWPVLFEPTVAVEVLQREQAGSLTTEQFRITATVGGDVRSWTSRRELDAQQRTIRFRQEHSVAPLASMSGCWTFRPAAGGTDLVLQHTYQPSEDTAEARQWIEASLDTNSERELGAVARVLRSPYPVPDLLVECEDTVSSEEGVDFYEFIDRADRWPAALAHVLQVELQEHAAGVQDLQMSVRTPDGGQHRTHSIRLCTPRSMIRYKQLVTPDGLLGHGGVWEFGSQPDGRTIATSRHLALIDPGSVSSEQQLAEARARIGAALSANSRATLARAARQPAGATQ